MLFQLPSNLKTELMPYDPVLKKLVREEKAATSNRKKPKYPVGNPPALFPVDIVSKETQQDVIDEINRKTASDRFHEFRRMEGTPPDAEFLTYAVVYHWEGQWIAAWLPPVGKESEYVFGYTYCYKDTAANRNKLSYAFKRQEVEFEEIFINRSAYMIHTKLVTNEMIHSNPNTDYRVWFLCEPYSQKGREMSPAVKRFEATLRKSIPTWTDQGGIFDRLRDGDNLFKLVFGSRSDDITKTRYWQRCQERYGMDENNWELNVETYFTFVDTFTSGYDSDLAYVKKVRHILDKPVFRKYIQTQLSIANYIYKDPLNTKRRSVVASIKRITSLARAINFVETVWPNTPIDYYQSHIGVLIGTKNYWSCRDSVVAWLRKHMPVASYFHLISKHYNEKIVDKREINNRWNFEEDLDCYQFRFQEFEDTLSMLAKIFENGKDLEPPKRWRITEFHDHVQAEAWKVSNPNQGLPQDLFPEPIKVEYDDKRWSFFQPIDTHQLSQWGQAVRNCIGNASHYAEGVKKKQHFIVLCMLDGKPTFTVLLKVNNGMLSVDQIVSFANGRLSDADRADYTAAFSAALQEQEKRLKSSAAAA